MHGIVGEPGSIVAIGVAADQPEDALLHQREDALRDLAGVAPGPQAIGRRWRRAGDRLP